MAQPENKTEPKRVFGLSFTRTWQVYVILIVANIVAIGGFFAWNNFVPENLKRPTIVAGLMIAIIAITVFSTLLVRKAFVLRATKGNQLFFVIIILSLMVFCVDAGMIVILIGFVK